MGRHGVTLWMLGSALAALAGTLAPWVVAVPGVTVLQGGPTNDPAGTGPWMVLAAAAAAGLVFFVAQATPTGRVVALVAALTAFGLALYDRYELGAQIKRANGFGAVAKVGWGLDLALLATASMAVAAAVAAQPRLAGGPRWRTWLLLTSALAAVGYVALQNRRQPSSTVKVIAPTFGEAMQRELATVGAAARGQSGVTMRTTPGAAIRRTQAAEQQLVYVVNGIQAENVVPENVATRSTLMDYAVKAHAGLQDYELAYRTGELRYLDWGDSEWGAGLVDLHRLAATAPSAAAEVGVQPPHAVTSFLVYLRSRVILLRELNRLVTASKVRNTSPDSIERAAHAYDVVAAETPAIQALDAKTRKLRDQFRRSMTESAAALHREAAAMRSHDLAGYREAERRATLAAGMYAAYMWQSHLYLLHLVVATVAPPAPASTG